MINMIIIIVDDLNSHTKWSLVYEHKNEDLNKDEEGGDDYFADGKDGRLHGKNESSMCVWFS